MSRRVRLHEIAHARAGDKGDTSNVCLFVYEPRHYPALVRALAPERLRAAFPALLRGPVRLFPLPRLHGVNLVMENALEGGVNASLNLDGHGKSWSFLLLSLEVEIED
ncbi:MAG: hypothetical protein RMK73_03185 [Geminicoccaceae bacterium]|nr:hypothetical protein [Geminicoccaceae bacterium]MDW8125279.1 hypothetical protein [Geminicoccaceae bacterium]MDW8340469.1 hypothetical protein [Geminicoccaceae bacterium]